MSIENDLLFQELVRRRQLTNKGTIGLYKTVLAEFSTAIGKSLHEIIQEGKNDYKNRVFIDEGSVFKYIQKYHLSLKSRDLKSSTISTMMSKVFSFYRTFFIIVPPFAGREPFTSKKKKITDIITIEDIRRLCSISSIKYKALIQLCFNTSLRVGDILKLDCIDLINATKEYHDKNTIKRVLSDLEKQENVVPTWHNISNKTNVSHYTYNTPQTTKILVEYLKTREKLENKDPVFVSMIGNRMSYSAGRHYLRKLSDELEYGAIEGSNRQFIHFHGFRDSFASTLLPHVDKFKLENWMGHSHSDRDNSYYVQNSKEDKKLYMSVMRHITL